ncbi:MAG: hypothetical protein R3B47_14965 [Bacteroidia bacterium]
MYAQRLNDFRQKHLTLQKQVEQISWLRLVVFVSGLGLGWFLMTISYLLGGIGIIGMAALFLFLVQKHAQREARADFQERMANVNEAEIVLAEGKAGPYDHGQAYIEQQHPYSYDLDLFGGRSVFAFINRTASRPGRDRLANWLLHGLLEPKTIIARQDALKDLAPRLEFRQAFQAEGSKSQSDSEDLTALLEWLQTDLKEKAAPVWLRWLMPVQFIIVFISSLVFSLDWYIILGSFLVNLLIVRQFLGRTQKLHSAVDKRSKVLSRYAKLLQLAENEAFESDYMQSLQARLGIQNHESASSSIKRLGNISSAFDQRLNIMAALFLNGFYGWDLHLSARLESWKEGAKNEVPGWLDVLAELDALISLATFAYNHPSFNWPEPLEYPRLDGLEMGHILIPQEERVNNDLKLDQQGQYGLVTGANMAGKSTFLRTVGVNLVLAQAGAPVCAKRFRWKPAAIFTSMRATDSVQDRASYFYAELVRLRRIAELLKNGTEAYILLDEILRGTNSKDKAAGSRGFIEQLIAWPGMGLVATHDLSLSDLEAAYPDKIKNLRFEIEIEDDKLYCSYKLQPGVSQNLNATFLMRQMGIVK